ncbi:MAG: class I SAM-dependent methyltransferase [Sporomusaceae bacterium]|nr:class I SAM-dependent methyltransferase [Sporomusaceae bacterium]
MLKKLNEESVKTFNQDYVTEATWQMVVSAIEQQWGNKEFSFADLGGGNGLFTDRILAAFPQASGTLIDNSPYLIKENRPHERKRLIFDSIEQAPRHIQSVDIVFCNWLLHHLVADSYQVTRQNIVAALRLGKGLLAKDGRMSIFENLYEGILFHNLPSHLIFSLTSQTKLAPLLRRFGANTAGCGVCFLSKPEWRQTLKQSGLMIERVQEDEPWDFSWGKRALLHIKSVRVGHFWCK